MEEQMQQQQQFRNFKETLFWNDLVGLTDKKVVNKVCKLVSWTPPITHVYKLNSDGSFKEDKCGCGGIVRNWEGKLIIMVFSIQFMGDSSILGETKALFYGFHWCKLNGVSRIQLETDSLMLVACIKDVYKIP
ncbi:uncharacterized protein [Solanum lycopersicum]|uniref:uncharacterized protein n=1 Tax=Solanum lycopersicum TaxID=4081 RepID=UPI0008FECED0|nr:uncharacterized protein LOC109119073 [Solanum lycopersicum]